MSEAEHPDRLAAERQITVEDIRTLAGASTPHFALQVRNRIRRLIDPLPPDDPARIEGERQIATMEELAEHSGDPRGPGPEPPGLHAGPPREGDAAGEGAQAEAAPERSAPEEAALREGPPQ